MPFRDPRGGDLASRIESELRERLEEAIDAACLDTLVRVRQAQRLPLPQADSAQDRAEYHTDVGRLLERLDAALGNLASAEPASRARAGAAGQGEADPRARLMATQVTLARTVPDYWQRFDAIRLEYAAERTASSGESRGLLRRLFGLR